MKQKPRNEAQEVQVEVEEEVEEEVEVEEDKSSKYNLWRKRNKCKKMKSR